MHIHTFLIWLGNRGFLHQQWPLMLMIQKTVASNWSYYAKQVGQSGVRAAENAYLSAQMAHGGAERVDGSVPCHLRPAVQRVVQRIPPLMKFDILENDRCHDSTMVEGEGDVNYYKLPHLCTPAPLFQGECVMEVLVISKSTGDTSFSSIPQRYTQSNDRSDDTSTSE